MIVVTNNSIVSESAYSATLILSTIEPLVFVLYTPVGESLPQWEVHADHMLGGRIFNNLHAGQYPIKRELNSYAGGCAKAFK